MFVQPWNGSNLLKIQGKSVADYGRRILRTIFTTEELASSILPPGGPQYTRKPLEHHRFELFHRIYFSFLVSHSTQLQFFQKHCGANIVFRKIDTTTFIGNQYGLNWQIFCRTNENGGENRTSSLVIRIRPPRLHQHQNKIQRSTLETCVNKSRLLTSLFILAFVSFNCIIWFIISNECYHEMKYHLPK